MQRSNGFQTQKRLAVSRTSTAVVQKALVGRQAKLPTAFGTCFRLLEHLRATHIATTYVPTVAVFCVHGQ